MFNPHHRPNTATTHTGTLHKHSQPAPPPQHSNTHRYTTQTQSTCTTAALPRSVDSRWSHHIPASFSLCLEYFFQIMMSFLMVRCMFNSNKRGFITEGEPPETPGIIRKQALRPLLNVRRRRVCAHRRSRQVARLAGRRLAARPGRRTLRLLLGMHVQVRVGPPVLTLGVCGG